MINSKITFQQLRLYILIILLHTFVFEDCLKYIQYLIFLVPVALP